MGLILLSAIFLGTITILLWWITRRIIGRKFMNNLIVGDVISCEWYLAASLFDSKRTRYFTVTAIFENAIIARAHDNQWAMRFTPSRLYDFKMKRTKTER